jgi:hypothetical protein
MDIQAGLTARDDGRQQPAALVFESFVRYLRQA